MDCLTVIIGRSNECQYIALDPRVSRKHAEARQNTDGSIEIKDLGSTNGTYVNQRRIAMGQWKRVSSTDLITLSTDYVLDLKALFPALRHREPDKTKILSGKVHSSIQPETGERRTYVKSKSRTYAFDPDKTSISDMSQMDETPFKTIGRVSGNDIVLPQGNISREHCRIRMLNKLMIQIEDLGSTNGTFADGVRLEAKKLYTFRSSVSIQVGPEVKLNLKRVLPGLEIPPPQSAAPAPQQSKTGPPNAQTPLTPSERKAFEELQSLWQEYQERQNQASSASMGYMMGGSIIGSVLGMALMPVTGGLSALVSLGGTALGRYLGMQKTNEIRNDLSYEDAFLQAYACPRCLESFQKKPWVTIRECPKCRVKFR